MFALGDAVDGIGLEPELIIAALPSLLPGPDLHTLLTMLDPDQLDEAQVIAAGAAWERQRRHDAATEYALLARLEALPIDVPDDLDPEDDRRSGRMGPAQWRAVFQSERSDAYAVATGQSAYVVARKTTAALLCAPDGPLAATGAALSAGLVSESRARLIAEKLADLPPADAAAIEAAVLPDADQLARARLGRELDTRVGALQATSAQEAADRARAARRVTRPQPMPDGAAMLEVHGPAEDVLLHTALTSIGGLTQDAARAAVAGDPAAQAQVEGIDAHRFDALINVADGAIAAGGLPTRHGRRPAIAITMALSTLLGLDDHPAQLAGYGPITAEAARRAAADPTGTLQRLITRPDGLVIDAAHTGYRPPQALADTIVARDGTCTYPRCDRPATETDLDHEVNWPDGATAWSNLGARCRRHHNQKTAGLTAPSFDRCTGDTIWTDRRGRTARRPALRHPDPPVTQLARPALVCEGDDDPPY